jgi:hypothetical protein
MDTQKITFDSEGKIIRFKYINSDSFFKEFRMTSDNIKMEKTIGAHNIEIPDNKEIIMNPLDKRKGPETYNFKKINYFQNCKETFPAGSNFTIMLPNIGVTVKEDEKVKKGTDEFSTLFKRFSIKEFHNLISMNSLQNKSQILNTCIGKDTNNYNYLTNIANNSYSVRNNNLLSSKQNLSELNNLYNSSNTENVNPLLFSSGVNLLSNEANLETNNNSSIVKTVKSYKNDSLFNYALNLNSKNSSRNNKYKYDGMIKMSSNRTSTSLKYELDSLRDLDSVNKNKSNLIINSINKTGLRNLFLEKNKSLLYYNKYKNLNEFNKKNYA